MRIDVLTIFSKMFNGPLTESLVQRARNKGLLSIHIKDIRSFSSDTHNKVDDRPFGGGPGMVMKAEPIYEALRSVGAVASRKKEKPYVIYLSPQGRQLDQSIVMSLSEKKHLVLLCGHYEGVDERILRWVDDEISIGDYVLTGGEIPAMVLIDAVARNLPGVIKEAESVQRDSFYNGLLDFPHYTRPAKFKGTEIPKVLLSGNHAKIELWRTEQSLKRTKKRRPDLIKKNKAPTNKRKQK